MRPSGSSVYQLLPGQGVRIPYATFFDLITTEKENIKTFLQGFEPRTFPPWINQLTTWL
jgi:hypothetical protein